MQLGVDYVHANELTFQDGKLTGEIRGEIVDGNRKAELLQAIAKKEGLSLKQVIAVGDGANDIPMLKLAGLGVAFHAKPKVKEQVSALFVVSFVLLSFGCCWVELMTPLC